MGLAIIKTTTKTEGFTLIELLVVLVIIALFSGMVVLSIGDNFARKMQSEAERLRSIVIAASDEAIYTSSEIGIYFTDGMYQLLRWNPVAQGWVPFATQPFQPHTLPGGMKVEVTVDGFVVPQDSQDDQQELVDFDFDDDASLFFGGEQDSLTPDEESRDGINRQVGGVVDLKPQVIALSSGELSVFEIKFFADESLGNSSAYLLFTDGFSLPRIKNISLQDTAQSNE